MRPPYCRNDSGDVPAVFGYGDANADFHVVGDHPGVHGGATTGVPFTETDAGERIQDVLRELGFAAGSRERPHFQNCFASYLHMCSLEGRRTPTEREYDELERYFDAELRAINAHILVAVGNRATDHLLREFTTQRHRFDAALDAADLHGRDLRGRGFLVVPVREPAEWESGDRTRLVRSLESILHSDYRQTKGVATLIG